MHVPFCAKACPYCDYPHAVPDRPGAAHDAFVQAVCAEIRRHTRFRGRPVGTVYLGGGTPSQLSKAHLAQIFDALHDTFGELSAPGEVTLEANPDDLALPFLEAVRALGVNRLSLGVQSFFAGDLRFLGRRHGAGEAAQAVPLARAAGFENVSLDLLFGLPGQPHARWQATLEKAARLAPAHVTLYRLTADPGTLLGRRVASGAVQLPGEDRTAAHYEQALDTLQQGDGSLRLYEQTHLARPGRASAHTRRYWRHAPVLGFGPGAHSFFWTEGATAVRRANAPAPGAYAEALAAGKAPPGTRETLSRQALADEYVAQRLRTTDGLWLERLRTRYARDLRATHGPTLDRLLAEGYVERCGAGAAIRPTRAGRLRLGALTTALLPGA